MAELLRAIAASEPAAWYPGEFARSHSVPRDSIDEPLNRLRMSGLVQMSDWEAGKGQGYFLTSDGRRALLHPARLNDTAPASAAKPSGPRLVAVTDDAKITRILIAAQVGVFLLGFAQAMEIGLPANVYLASGTAPIREQLAVSARALVVDGRWWTLLSYALVHAGLMHLGCNLLGHYYDASLLERLLGRARYLAVYLNSVLFGGIGAVIASPQSMTVGSSGGLCGVFAAQFVWFAAQRHLFRQSEWNNLTRHYMRVALLVVIISSVPGVSWGGHLGGAIGGLMTGAAFHFLGKPESRWAKIGWLAALLLPVLGLIGLWWKLYR